MISLVRDEGISKFDSFNFWILHWIWLDLDVEFEMHLRLETVRFDSIATESHLENLFEFHQVTAEDVSLNKSKSGFSHRMLLSQKEVARDNRKS